MSWSRFWYSGKKNMFQFEWLFGYSSFCCSKPWDQKSLGELQFKAKTALQRRLSQVFQSVLPKEEFLILLNIHIINGGEPSFPSISVASTYRTWKIIWIEFTSDLPEKWLHNRFLAGEYLTLMTLLVILPLTLTLSPLFLSLPVVSKAAHFLPFSNSRYVNMWAFHTASWWLRISQTNPVTFLKSRGMFLTSTLHQIRILKPKLQPWIMAPETGTGSVPAALG